MIKTLKVGGLFVAFLLSTGFVACADEWSVYRSEEYGFSVLLPKGASKEEKEWKNGWVRLYCKYEGIEFYGLAKRGTEATADEIEEIGVEVSGILEDDWKKIDEGKNSNGWKWYRLYKAEGRGAVVYAGLGAGPKGSYLLFLKTTTQDVKENESEYKKWHESLKVF